MPAPDPVTIALVQPVQAHGETQTALTLRPITGRDLRLHGDPRKYEVRRGGSTVLTWDTEAMAGLVSALAGVPVSTVDQLDPRDWDACSAAITGFFGPGDATAPAS